MKRGRYTTVAVPIASCAPGDRLALTWGRKQNGKKVKKHG